MASTTGNESKRFIGIYNYIKNEDLPLTKMISFDVDESVVVAGLREHAELNNNPESDYHVATYFGNWSAEDPSIPEKIGQVLLNTYPR